VLGLKLATWHYYADGKERSAWFDLGQGTILMLEDSGATTTPPQIGGWHLVALGIAPTTRSAWLTYLQAKGIAITAESAYSIYFNDPEGNRLALSHYPHS